MSMETDNDLAFANARYAPRSAMLQRKSGRHKEVNSDQPFAL